MLKIIPRVAATAFYALCCAAVLTFLSLGLLNPVSRSVNMGRMLMCTLPTLLTVAAFCRVWNIKISRRMPLKNWLIAVPLAICGLYLAYVIISIILMTIALFAVTLLKLL